MALPSLVRKIFENDGYGPKLKPSIIPFAASLAADGAGDVASAEWLKDLAVAPVYLASGGSDANSGLSPDAPVGSFAKAIEIGSSLPQQKFKIVVSAGTYTENIEIHDTFAVIELAGNVTLSGSFAAYDSILYIQESSSDSLFTITGYLDLHNVDCLNSVALSVGSASNANSINISINSYCYFNKPVTVNANVSRAVAVSICSNVFFNDALTVSGTTISSVVTVWNLSSCILSNGINVTATSITDIPIRCDAESHLTIDGSIYIPSFTYYTCVYCSTNSYISIVGSLTATKKSNNGYFLYSDRSSFIQVLFNSTSVFTASGGNINTFFYANNGSVLALLVDGSSTPVVKLTGTVNWGTAVSTYLSFLQVNPSISFSGSSVTGKRYDVHHCAAIDVGAGGSNVIPGSTAGTAHSDTYGVYH